MTVSRVVNGADSVVADTRRKVEAAIAELNYRPNPAARSLAGQGQCRLALLYDNPSAAFMTELMMGSLGAARQSDTQLLIEPYDPQEAVQALCGRLRHHRVEGVLLPPPMCDDLAAVDELSAAGFSLARIAAALPSPLCHTVSIDDEAAAYAITAHLVALGHRRIGFVAGLASFPFSALRRAGYERALRDAGVAPGGECTARGDYTFRSGLGAAETLLSLPNRPTAIFASNDDMAAAVVAVAHQHGLAVPGDLSVCGFDDSAMARTIWPELTTIRQPAAAMAAQATSVLSEQIRSARRSGSAVLRHIRLDFELIRRGSDGPPPA